MTNDDEAKNKAFGELLGRVQRSTIARLSGSAESDAAIPPRETIDAAEDPVYPIRPRAMSEEERRDASRFVDAIAKSESPTRPSLTFAHLCRLLADDAAHGFTRHEAMFILDAMQPTYAAPEEKALAESIRRKLREAWL